MSFFKCGKLLLSSIPSKSLTTSIVVKTRISAFLGVALPKHRESCMQGLPLHAYFHRSSGLFFSSATRSALVGIRNQKSNFAKCLHVHPIMVEPFFAHFRVASATHAATARRGRPINESRPNKRYCTPLDISLLCGVSSSLIRLG